MRKCSNCKNKLSKSEQFCSKCGKSKKELKKIRTRKRLKKLLKLVIIIVIIYGIYKLNNIIQLNFNNNEIKLTNFESTSKNGDVLFVVDNKLDKIEGKIASFSKIQEGHIKIYVGNLILVDEDLTNKKFSIKDFNLVKGINQIDISYKIKDKVIEKTFYILNKSDENLGTLDNRDLDNDGIPNYLEDAYGTNKKVIDTDNDKLTDYQEIYITNTNPISAYTYGNIIDSEFDSDKDGISNIKEIEIKTNPLIKDTDDDGLNDGEELSIGSNPLKIDTDDDGLNDFEEVKKYNSSPLQVTNVVSGNISDIENIIVYVENINASDVSKIKITEGKFAKLNEKLEGYILPPYKIDTKLNITPIIAFDLNNIKLNENSNPVIYEIDNKTFEYKEIQSNISNGIIYARVTNKDNLYMVYDKNYFSYGYNKIKADTKEVQVEIPQVNHYLVMDIPILHFFAGDTVTIFVYGDFDEEIHEKIKNTLERETFLKYEFSHIDNDLQYEVIRYLQKWLINSVSEKNKDKIKEIAFINPESEGNVLYDTIAVFDFANIEDVEKYFIGENRGLLSTSIKVEMNLKDTTDTNHDGISDAITELIIGGYIKTKEGYNPFEGLTLEQINKNKDFDGDTIINGDEISVVLSNGVYELDMKSDPTKKDSDDDTIVDTKDPSPLCAFNSKYMLRDTLKGEPSNINILKKQVEEYNSLFGKGKERIDGKIEYIDVDGQTKYSNKYEDVLGYGMINAAAELGHVIGLQDAAKAEDRYKQATGETFTENDVSEKLIQASDIQKFLNIEIENYKEIAVNAVANGEKLVFENKNLGIATKAEGTKETFWKDMNSIMFLHYASNNTIAEISNKNGKYTIKLRYFIEDVYDWKKQVVEGDGSSEIEVMYFNKLLLGKAKAFLIHIEYDVEITYDVNTGETNIKYYDTPAYK